MHSQIHSTHAHWREHAPQPHHTSLCLMQVHAAVELFHACHLLMTAPPLLPSVSSLQSLPTSVHASWELPGCSGLGPISPDAAQLHLAGALTASVCYRPHQP